MYVESVKALKAHFMHESDIQPPLDPHLTLNPIAQVAPEYFHSLVREKGDSKKGRTFLEPLFSFLADPS